MKKGKNINENIPAQIYRTIEKILEKVNNPTVTFSPEVRAVIAERIKNYYIDSDIEIKSLRISYMLFRKILETINSSKKEIQLQELNQLAETAKRYYIDPSLAEKTLRKSLKHYEMFDEDLKSS